MKRKANRKKIVSYLASNKQWSILSTNFERKKKPNESSELISIIFYLCFDSQRRNQLSCLFSLVWQRESIELESSQKKKFYRHTRTTIKIVGRWEKNLSKDQIWSFETIWKQMNIQCVAFDCLFHCLNKTKGNLKKKMSIEFFFIDWVALFWQITALYPWSVCFDFFPRWRLLDLFCSFSSLWYSSQLTATLRYTRIIISTFYTQTFFISSHLTTRFVRTRTSKDCFSLSLSLFFFIFIIKDQLHAKCRFSFIEIVLEV